MLRVVKNVTWGQRITNEVLYAGLIIIIITYLLMPIAPSGA